MIKCYLFWLFKYVVPWYDSLLSLQVWCDSLLSGVGRPQLRHRVQEPKQGSVAVEGRDVEEELPRFEREEERRESGNFFQPGWQIWGHDDDGVLQLPVHLGRQLGVDELLLVDDGTGKKIFEFNDRPMISYKLFWLSRISVLQQICFWACSSFEK